ncbi:hypothetical protein M3Y94_01177600 [Aphelenchoides besseyi]|nr:hypothetical protein M3Y94_01177600 [Aphelenchoides besseyi]KAI6228211.1 hypothetical protein M3Y95_00598800 [Aphelenchoides besseyi]
MFNLDHIFFADNHSRMSDYDDPDGFLSVFVVRLIVGILAVLSNILVISIFLKFPAFRRIQSNILISLLSVSGFIVGLGILVRAIYSKLVTGEKGYHRIQCLAIGQIQMFGVVFGQVLLFALALDRYSAVRWPCHYMINLRIRITIVVGTCIVVGVFFSLLSFWNVSDETVKQCTVGAASTTTYQAVWLSCGFLNSFFVIGLYVRAVRLLNQKLTSKYSKHLHTLRVQQRAFISISLIVICYLIFCCVPIFLSILVFVLNGSEVLRGHMSILFGIGEAFNSSIMVFIYLLKHHEIRVYSRKLFTSARKTSLSFTTRGALINTPRNSRASIRRKPSCRIAQT